VVFRTDDEFHQPGLILQFPHIGQQVTQPQGSMGITGIEGGKQDGHERAKKK
jgi:hypothetical protein